jgi:hypothetical protein
MNPGSRRVLLTSALEIPDRVMIDSDGFARQATKLQAATPERSLP